MFSSSKIVCNPINFLGAVDKQSGIIKDKTYDIYEKSIELDKKGSYAIKNLFLPGMMGNYFKVLIQMKNIKEVKGFYPDSELKVSFGIN